jgi:radical SAM/Cys-rich protein
MASAAPKTLPTLQALGSDLASGATQLARLARVAIRDERGGDFDRHLARADLAPLRASGIEILQVNVGKLCNQTCAHCHVDAGPTRTEIMTPETAELCLEVLAKTDIGTVDLTGGAPELCPSFERLVTGARALGRKVLDRCNLTVLTLPRSEGLPEFLAGNQVEVVCSLPHYRALSTDRQRGEGVYERSIEGLRKLNAVGYGREGSGLRLVLVTNPVGAFLPGASQKTMLAEWKRELLRLHGIEFNDLYTITNMPISRFLDWLIASGNLEDYLQKLVDAFHPGAAAGVMCRNTLSVGWDGVLYDCDFNQMLEMPVGFDQPRHLRDFDRALLDRRRVATARHCFGCTAGAGSSCGGQTA